MDSYYDISGFNGTVLLVVGNVFIDNDASVVTLSISSRGFVSPVFSGAHKDKVCVRTFIVVSV